MPTALNALCLIGVLWFAGCSDPVSKSLPEVADDAATPTDTVSGTTDTPSDATSNDTSDVGPSPDVPEPDASADATLDLNVDWARLQYPLDHRGEPATTLTVYGRVFEAGITEGTGAGRGLEAEVGVGPADTAPETWQWQRADFSIDVDDAVNDEFVAVLELPSSGLYRYAFRFRLQHSDGVGPWLYADLDGSDNGFEVARAGMLEVIDPLPKVVDWCRLEGPATISTVPNSPSGTLYGRVYEAQLTDVDMGDAGLLVVEIGVGTEALEGWTWTAAEFARRVGNDFEFGGSFLTPPWEGEARYAFRARLRDGNMWTYCDLGGSNDGFDLADTGTLKIEIPPVDVIDYASMSPTEIRWNQTESLPEVEVVVFEATRTVGLGAASGVEVEVGVGSLETAMVWFEAAYDRDEDGLGSLDNDVYSVTLPPLAPGNYDFVARVTLDGSPLLVDATGTSDGYDPLSPGRLVVSEAPPAVLRCRLDAANTVSVGPGVTIGPLRLEVDLPNRVEPTNTLVTTEIGYGRAGSAPMGGTWLFTDALISEGPVASGWRFFGDLVAPLDEGLWDAAGRVRLSTSDPANPASWTYCDRDGSENGYGSEQAMRIAIEVPRVDYCRIQFPRDPITVKAGTSTPLLFGVVYEPGLTGEGATPTPALVSEVGFGAVGSVPDETWSWSRGAFNVYMDNGFGQWTNDEHRGALLPPTAGTFAWAWRFSLDGGRHWRACDKAGNLIFDPNEAGLLVVEEAQ